MIDRIKFSLLKADQNTFPKFVHGAEPMAIEYKPRKYCIFTGNNLCNFLQDLIRPIIIHTDIGKELLD